MAVPTMRRRIRNRVNATNVAFAAALAGGDAAAAAGLYAPEARLLAPGTGLLRGRDAITRFWQAGIEIGITAVQLETLDLDDDVALELGRYRLRVEAEGSEAVTDRGHYVVIHKRQSDGSWMWAVEIFNSDGAADAEKSGSGGATLEVGLTTP
jgi:uncharacterized protein (TIGR02246 family)